MKSTLYSTFLILFLLSNSYSFFFKTKNTPLKVFSGPIKVAIMGSTGSVGTQALEVIRNLNNLEGGSEPKFKVVALSAKSNHKLLSQQVNEFKPQVCHILKNYEKLPNLLKRKCEILSDKSDLLDLCRKLDYDLIIMAISGCDGIEPTMAAAESGKKIALSNKESVVSAGSLLSKVVKKYKTTVIPVDSEHNAIFQCLDDGKVDTTRITYVTSISSQVLAGVKNLILTTSGGPFLGKKYPEYKNLKTSDNISHPVWKMGSKITVDSSTMMNKALEVLEAHHLFGIHLDNIKILVHKECLVHSLVEFVDNSVLCQMYLPDMKLPISHSLNWPNRTKNSLPPLDLRGKTLTFKEVDFENFPFLCLGYEVGRLGGLYPAVFNAANDVANDLFRSNMIDYDQLYHIVRETVEEFNNPDLNDDSLQDIMYADSWAKETANKVYSRVVT
uniref:1-deoxy-D-xylulose 5-phosphate reductoisomerase, apicoplastic n=1 Tax=Theileria annulata TaxID=5874 RepID=A0A3B0NAJ1_THEAN